MGDCLIRYLISKKALFMAGYNIGQEQPQVQNQNQNQNGKDNYNNSSLSQQQRFCIVSILWSADTSLREMMEKKIQLTINNTTTSIILDVSILHFLETYHGTTLWDCTMHPPVVITDWVLEKYNETCGPKCKTLHSCGWYPSGTIQLLAKDETYEYSISILQNDQQQYNTTSSNSNFMNSSSQQQVMLLSTAAGQQGFTLPSQVLNSVLDRFKNDDDDNNDEVTKVKLRRIQQQKQIQYEKEQNRIRQLDTIIQKVKDKQQSGKNQNVSNQVQKMLMKSRALGRKELDFKDRIHFLCYVVMWDDNNDENDDDNDNNDKKNQKNQNQNQSEVHYRYFSIQDTVGRILESFPLQNGTGTSPPPTRTIRNTVGTEQKNMQKGSGYQSELLVVVDNNNNKDSDNNTKTYARLPTLMRLYEAIEQQYIKDFDEIIIQHYDNKTNVPTQCITDYDFIIKPVENTNDIDIIALDKQQDDDSFISQNDGGNDEKSGSDDQPMKTNVITSPNESETIIKESTTTCTKTTMDIDSNDKDFVIIERIKIAVQGWIDNDNNNNIAKSKKKMGTSTTKPLTSAMKKVQQMQMKSKAHGDTKRIQILNHRYYFHLVVLVDNDKDDKCPCNMSLSGPYFLALSDRINRIERDCCSSNHRNISNSWDIYIQHPITHENKVEQQQQHDYGYQKVDDTTITFQQGLDQNIIEQFATIIIRFYTS